MKNLFKYSLLALLTIGLLSACKKDNQHLYSIDRGSVASWKGFLENNYFNSGTIAVTGSDFSIVNETISSGAITIPVSSILITNQLTEDDKAALVHHLESDDFFKMAIYPNVIYHVHSTEKLAVADEKGNNYVIKGDLELLGKSLPLEIPSKIQFYHTVVHLETNFQFDRTKWGMTFASDPSLPPKDKIKNDISVSLDLNLSRY